jgi:hypothetical protein
MTKVYTDGQWHDLVVDEDGVELVPEPQVVRWYRCEACGCETVSPAMHENVDHDGAQTCWPTDGKDD